MISVRNLGSWLAVSGVALSMILTTACGAPPSGGGNGGAGNGSNGGGALGGGHMGGGITPGGSGGPGPAPSGTTGGPSGPASTVTVCNGLAAFAKRCNDQPVDVQTCEAQFGSYSMAGLSAAYQCTQRQDCDANALNSCIDAAANAGGGQTGGDAGAPPQGNACDQCAQQNCSNQINTCKADSECVALFECLSMAQTQQDVNACANQHPNGINDFEAVSNCLKQDCSAACGQ